MRGAFTLVELLVVIGIIALLISILLPTLARARESSNRIKCAANLRSAGQALRMFNDEQKRLPFTQAVTNTPNWMSYMNGFDFKRLLQSYRANVDAFVCPSAVFRDGSGTGAADFDVAAWGASSQAAQNATLSITYQISNPTQRAAWIALLDSNEATINATFPTGSNARRLAMSQWVYFVDFGSYHYMGAQPNNLAAGANVNAAPLMPHMVRRIGSKLNTGNAAFDRNPPILADRVSAQNLTGSPVRGKILFNHGRRAGMAAVPTVDPTDSRWMTTRWTGDPGLNVLYADGSVVYKSPEARTYADLYTRTCFFWY